MAAVGLGDGAVVRRVAGVAGHDRAHARVDSGLEADELILLEGALGRVQSPLTLIGVGLEAVLSGAVAREVLGGEHDGLLVHALGAVLVAIHQRGDDTGHGILTLAVGAGVARPAGVGRQVDLRAIHENDALRAPHLAVHLGIILDGVVVAVAQHRSGHAQGIREARSDGIGDQGVRDGRGARVSGIPLGNLSSDVSQERHDRSVIVQAAAVHARTHLARGEHLIIRAREAGGIAVEHIQVAGDLALSHHREDLGRVNGAVLVLDLSKGLGNGVDHQGVQHKAGLLLQGHLGHHIGGADARVLAPVLEHVELMVVVGVLEVQAVDLDDADGRHADGRAVLVLVEGRLQIGDGGIDFRSVVRSSDVLSAGLGQHRGHHAQEQRSDHDRAQNPFHANSPLSSL